MWGSRVDIAIALVAALIGHVALAAMLIVGVGMFQPTPDPIPVVDAMIVTDVEGRLGRVQRERTEAQAAQRAEAARQAREQAEAEAARQAAEVARRQEAARQQAEAEERRQAEQAAREAAEQAEREAAERRAREAAEEEARRKAEEERRAAEARKQAEEEARRKAEEERKRKEEEARRKAEEERKRKEAEERKRREAEERRRKAEEERRRREAAERQARIDAMREAMEAESQAREQAALATKRQKYVSDIAYKVRQNWLRPPGMAENFECRVEVKQLPSGELLDVRIVDSCGNNVLDDSVVRAVEKSDPLPTGDPGVFEDTLIFTFKPQDNR